MADFIRAGVGTRRYELQRTWWQPLLVLGIAIGALPFLLGDDDVGAFELVLWFGTFLVAAAFLESTHRSANYVILHPDRADVSERAWTPKAKRRKHYIPYANLVSVSADAKSGLLEVKYKPAGGVAGKLHIPQLIVAVHVRPPEQATEIKEAMEFARESTQAEVAKSIRSTAVS